MQRAEVRSLHKQTVYILTALLTVAPVVAAGHGGSNTVHRCYELGTSPVAVNAADPVGVTCDDSIDVGGVIVEDAPPGTSSVQVTVVDDVFGANSVAATLCIDEDQDNICGGPGEASVDFCGSSPIVGFSHPATVVVFLGGPADQALQCDPGDAPTGATTGGLLSPSGGVFITYS